MTRVNVELMILIDLELRDVLAPHFELTTPAVLGLVLDPLPTPSHSKKRAVSTPLHRDNERIQQESGLAT